MRPGDHLGVKRAFDCCRPAAPPPSNRPGHKQLANLAPPRSLIFDLQLIMGNGQLALSPDEYIMATLNIYLVGGRGVTRSYMTLRVTPRPSYACIGHAHNLNYACLAFPITLFSTLV